MAAVREFQLSVLALLLQQRGCPFFLMSLLTRLKERCSSAFLIKHARKEGNQFTLLIWGDREAHSRKEKSKMEWTETVGPMNASMGNQFPGRPELGITLLQQGFPGVSWDFCSKLQLLWQLWIYWSGVGPWRLFFPRASVTMERKIWKVLLYNTV